MGSVAGTGLAVAWGAPGGIAVVAGLALVTLGTLRVIAAALADARVGVALAGMAVALARLAGAQVEPSSAAGVAGVTVLA